MEEWFFRINTNEFKVLHHPVAPFKNGFVSLTWALDSNCSQVISFTTRLFV